MFRILLIAANLVALAYFLVYASLIPDALFSGTWAVASPLWQYAVPFTLSTLGTFIMVLVVFFSGSIRESFVYNRIARLTRENDASSKCSHTNECA